MVFLLYAPICLVALRLLLPRLSLASRMLAIALLFAQIVMLVVALEGTPRWELKGWLWHLDQESSIPNTFASVQLALVSGTALMTALFSSGRHALYRLYLVTIGLLFLYLAWDEYFALHENNVDWKQQYLALGTVVVIATIFVRRRSQQPTDLWLRVFLAGLAISGVGAMVFKLLPLTCDGFGWLRIQGCLQYDFIEEAAEFVGIWLILVAALGEISNVAPKPRRLVPLFLFILAILWTILLTRDAWLPRMELRLRAKPALIEFESDLRLLGYQLNWDEESVDLWLYPSAWRSHYDGLGFSLHLIDQASGKSIASYERHTHSQKHLLQAPSYAHVYRKLLVVEIPPTAPSNRAYWIALSLWREAGGEFTSQEILESDHQLLSETQVILGEFALPAAPSAVSAVPLATFDGSLTLAEVQLPLRAHRGETLNISFSWHADAAGSDDYAQFLHLGHVDSGDWWVYDQQPLGARLPTRLWYSGLADSEVWAAPLPSDLASGEYAVYTGLYRMSDKERVPVKSRDGTLFVAARVPLGFLTLE